MVGGLHSTAKTFRRTSNEAMRIGSNRVFDMCEKHAHNHSTTRTNDKPMRIFLGRIPTDIGGFCPFL